MEKTKNIFKGALVVLFLLFVGSEFRAQEIDVSKTIGFTVTPKTYQVFRNKGNNFDLDYLLTSKDTEWNKKKKAFGMYAFNLEDKVSGFFIGDKLVGTGEIINIQDFELFTYIAVITEYKGKNLIVKYFISTNSKNEIDFACWWYDEESDYIIGEVSEKIEVNFIDED
jgi:hypothetical protein